MVTMIPQIPEPPTPQDPPAQFNQKAADSWAGLYAAVPKMNQQAEEIAQIGQDAGAAKVRAIAEADAALGYRNEAVAARDSAQGYATASGEQASAAAQSAGSAGISATRAETAAASAENRVPMTGPAGAAILPEGIQADRPDPPPAGGLLVRGNTTTGKPEWYNRATEAWEPIGDTSQLATQLGVVDAKVQALDANTGFTIIYPNGGTEAAPANVSINSTYLLPNPFPGFHVFCEAEVLYAGVWAKTGWVGAFATGVNRNDYYGVNAAPRSDDQILVTTGTFGLLAGATSMGGGHSAPTGAITTPLPSRVKVWKLKG